MEVSGHRKIGRLKLKWRDVIRKEKGVNIEEAYDRGTWRLKIRAPTPNREKSKEEHISLIRMASTQDIHVSNRGNLTPSPHCIRQPLTS